MTEKTAEREITELDLADVDHRVGKPVGGGQLWDPCSSSDIRRWVMAMDYVNPLHWDQRFAQETKFGDIIAPQSIAVALDYGHGNNQACVGRIDGQHPEGGLLRTRRHLAEGAVEDEGDAPDDRAVVGAGHEELGHCGPGADVGEHRHVLGRGEPVAAVGPDGELGDAGEIRGRSGPHDDGTDGLDHAGQPMRAADLVSDAP